MNLLIFKPLQLGNCVCKCTRYCYRETPLNAKSDVLENVVSSSKYEIPWTLYDVFEPAPG